jgi:WD40 repeat protein
LLGVSEVLPRRPGPGRDQRPVEPDTVEIAPVPRGYAYDAFLSYSHRDARAGAVALHRALERFNKPWYRPRGLRVFRDDVSLSANPHLWRSIEDALAQSAWLVVVCSPGGAASPWVDREIRWWLAHRGVSRILLVVAAGGLAPSRVRDGIDPDSSTAVPRVLADALPGEPRWVDLRGIGTGRRRSVAQRAALGDAVADIASAVQGRPKDLLHGAAVRRHRRDLRQVGALVAGLAAAVVVAVLASMAVATERDATAEQARAAKARQLGAAAEAVLDTDLDTGLLLATSAYLMDRSTGTRAALLDALTTAPQLVGNIAVGHPVTSLAGSADGSTIVVGTGDGYLIRWDTTDYRPVSERIGERPVTAIGIDRGGRTVVAATDAAVAFWGAGSAPRVVGTDPGRPRVVALSPSGATSAVLRERPGPQDGAGGVVLQEYAGGSPTVSAGFPTEVTHVGFADDASLVVADESGRWERRDAARLLVHDSSVLYSAPFNGYVPGHSTGGEFFGFAKNDSVVLNRTRTADTGDPSTPFETREARGFPTGETQALAISDDGALAAVADGGKVYVADALDAKTPPDAFTSGTVTAIPGVGDLDEQGLTFAGNDVLVGRHGSVLSVWDLAPDHGSLPGAPTAAPEPILRYSPDGSRVAVVSGFGQVLVGPAGSGRLEPVTGLRESDSPFPVFSPDGSTLYLLGAGAAARQVPRLAGVTVRPLPLPSADQGPLRAAEISSDGSRVALVDSTGTVRLIRTTDGAVLGSVPGGAEPFVPPVGANPNATGWAAVRADLAQAAVITDDGVAIHDIATGAVRALPGGPATEAVYRDRFLIVRRPTGLLELWDPVGLTIVHSLPDQGFERPIDYRPQSDALIRLRSDGTVVLTDVGTGQGLGDFPLPEPDGAGTDSVWSVTSLALEPGGGRLLTATSGGDARSWDLDENHWVARACRMAGRDLTEAEWSRFIGPDVPADRRCGTAPG